MSLSRRPSFIAMEDFYLLDTLSTSTFRDSDLGVPNFPSSFTCLNPECDKVSNSINVSPELGALCEDSKSVDDLGIVHPDDARDYAEHGNTAGVEDNTPPNIRDSHWPPLSPAISIYSNDYDEHVSPRLFSWLPGQPHQVAASPHMSRPLRFVSNDWECRSETSNSELQQYFGPSVNMFKHQYRGISVGDTAMHEPTKRKTGSTYAGSEDSDDELRSRIETLRNEYFSRQSESILESVKTKKPRTNVRTEEWYDAELDQDTGAYFSSIVNDDFGLSPPNCSHGCVEGKWENVEAASERFQIRVRNLAADFPAFAKDDKLMHPVVTETRNQAEWIYLWLGVAVGYGLGLSMSFVLYG